jgi:hypothetical protein
MKPRRWAVLAGRLLHHPPDQVIPAFISPEKTHDLLALLHQSQVENLIDRSRLLPWPL